MAVNQTLYKKVNYDPEKDFVPIALYLNSPFVLIVNPGVGVSTDEADFIARRPNQRSDRSADLWLRRAPARCSISSWRCLKQRLRLRGQSRALSQLGPDRDRRCRRPRKLGAVGERRVARADPRRQAEGTGDYLECAPPIAARRADSGRRRSATRVRGRAIAFDSAASA